MHGLYWKPNYADRMADVAISAMAQKRPLLHHGGICSGHDYIEKRVLSTKMSIFCLKTTHFGICKASSKKDIQDWQISNNVFNIYCLRKMQKWYIHKAFNQEGTKEHEPQQKKDRCESYETFNRPLYPTIFIWMVKKLIRHQWCSDSYNIYYLLLK